MYGACPDDYVKDRSQVVAALENCDKSFYVDMVVYPRKLTREEMKRYEIQPVSENTWDIQIGDKVFTTGRIEWAVMEHLKNGKVVVQCEIDGRKESQIEHQWDLTPKNALADGLASNPIKSSDSPSGEKLAEAAPVVEQEAIPTEPVAWANWLIENKERVVILDFETTDMQTNPPNFEAVQAGAITLDGEEVLNRYIRPYVSRITEGAFSVHGINNAVLDANSATTLITQYKDFEAALQGKIIIAYNSPFDKAALENSLKLCGLPPIEIHSWHDAMRLYTKHNPNKVNRAGRNKTNWSLVEAVAQQGLPVDENAHDALADVRMTLVLIKSMAADEPNRWKPVKETPAPKAERSYQVDDIVLVKASGIQAEVKKILPNGEISIAALEDGNRQTLRAGMIELVQKAEDRTPVTEEPVIEQPETAPSIEEQYEVGSMKLANKYIRLNDGRTGNVLSENGNDLLFLPDGSKVGEPVLRSELMSVISGGDTKAPIQESPKPESSIVEEARGVLVNPVIVPIVEASAIVIEETTPKQANPYAALESLVKAFGSRKSVNDALELIASMRDELYPENA
jgi:DNA polymerase-3 subunit epsilon